ncbi:hypothetical protein X737_31910 [Mesorhizobium sp. L48C026A00]|nr:hypothetical protein X737_31910 [Mesorhizobium sp. L48C026A00]
MISYNEAHNMGGVLENLKGFAQEVFLVDSYSTDQTVDIALSHGVHVVQRRFHGFGDQWNFAIAELPITAPWTMKLDPDERLTNGLKDSITAAIKEGKAGAWRVRRRLWFMGCPLPVTQFLLRGWRTGTCRFSDVLVNEHPLVLGSIGDTRGELEHHDSPDLHHWFDKQNRYSSAEALSAFRGAPLSAKPRLFGVPLERRMWLKLYLSRIPLRSLIIFVYCYFWQGAWRAGRPGYIWSRLRVDVYRMRILKLAEMRLRGRELWLADPVLGPAHPNAVQADLREDSSGEVSQMMQK